MPNSLFNSITDEKRMNFLLAATKELTTKSYKDVSISSIAKAAGISRGTFYNYFDSIGDLLEYFIDQIKEQRYKYMPDIFENEHFDMLLTFKQLFKYDYDEFVLNKRYTIIRNYLMYLNEENKSIKNKFIKKIIEPVAIQKNVPIFDQDKYRVTEEEFYYSIEMLSVLVSNLLTQSELQDMSKDEVFSRFNYIMDIFEKGMRK